jgi:hypothetical protein
MRRCQHCGRALAKGGKLFCSPACKARAWRRRRAGLAESSYPFGGSRGHVPLGELTRAERRAIALALDQVGQELR